MANFQGSQKNVFVRRTLLLAVALAAAAAGILWLLQHNRVFQRVSYAPGSRITFAVEEIDGSFSPFTEQKGGSAQVTALTQVKLLDQDRRGMAVLSGIQGEKSSFNGTEYTYYGPADLMIVPWEDGNVWYDFTLRQDITFSDGEKLTADDVIFTMYVLCDPSYEGSYGFGSLPIEGLSAYQNGEADRISGIVRVDDYKLRLVLTETGSLSVLDMMIPIAPLHYYGDPESYAYENQSFGFTKGETASLVESELTPMGAGPYCFASQNKETVSMSANQEYYLGAPRIPYLDLKGGEVSLELMAQGQADILCADYGTSNYMRLRDEAALASVKVCSWDNGETGELSFFLNAGRICVGGEPSSEASKNLRKAIATAFAFYREEHMRQAFADTVRVAEYPVLTNSLLYPRSGDPGYKRAYYVDADGSAVGNSLSGDGEDAVLAAVRGYLEAAGYILEEGICVEAPQGAALSYTVYNYSAYDENSGIKGICEDAALLLEKAGIGLDTDHVESDWDTYLEQIEEGTDIFVLCGTGTTNPYPVFGNYLAPSLFGIDDERINDAMDVLDNTVNKEEFLKAAYGAMDVILEWGVEVPVFMTQRAWYFDSEKMDISSLPGDMTMFYDWRDEIYRLQPARP